MAPEQFNEFRDRVEQWRNIARMRTERRQERSKETTDRRRRPAIPFRPGDLVLVARRIRVRGKTTKFLPKFTGPFSVVKEVCPTTYLVEDLPSERGKRRWRRFNAHVSQMKKLRAREETDWCPEDWSTDEEDKTSVALEGDAAMVATKTTRIGRVIVPPKRFLQ